ncbi:MAG: carbohydrate kinase family protein [Duncaniella sp.]|nr:carbohydrate kinase family protein [Duncaniella sp.]
MGKIIFIGELPLNLIFGHDGGVTVRPCDRIGRAAAALAAAGHSVVMVGEAAADPVGDLIVGYLASAGVDVRSVDRFTEGRSPQRDIFEQPDGTVRLVGYGREPDVEFDTVWPRIEPDDVVVFGSYFSLNDRVRPRLLDLLEHARARKATVVYLPYFETFQVPRVTRVMPSVLDNMELADVIVTTTDDLQLIFGNRDAADNYRLHIEFYTPRFYNIDTASATVEKFPEREKITVGTPGPGGVVDAMKSILSTLSRP